jgi:hypothetical protein
MYRGNFTFILPDNCKGDCIYPLIPRDGFLLWIRYFDPAWTMNAYGWRKYNILNIFAFINFAYFCSISHIAYVLKKFSWHRGSILYPKENISLIVGTKRKVSCRGIRKKFYILPLVCEYLLSMLFVIDNIDTFFDLAKNWTAIPWSQNL